MPSALKDRLRDPLARAGVPMTDAATGNAGGGILTKVRDNQYSGLITNFNELSSVPGMNPGIMNTLNQECYLAPFHVGEVQMVGPKVGAELRTKAVLATLVRAGRNAGRTSLSGSSGFTDWAR